MVVTNQLSVKMWLLYHITTRIHVLKTSQFDFIIKLELMFMTALVRGTKVILPGIMARLIQDTTISKRLCLLYCMGHTSILRANGVLLEGETFKVL